MILRKLKVRGFTLIELLVVIAVVSLLAAVASPVYSQYVCDSKIKATFPVITGLIKKAQEHMDKERVNVQFGDVGLTDYSGSYSQATAVSANWPGDSTIAFVDVQSFFDCSQPGAVTMVIPWYDTYQLGISDTPGSAGRLVFFVYKVDGVYTTACVNVDLLPAGEVLAGCTDEWPNVVSVISNGNPGCT